MVEALIVKGIEQGNLTPVDLAHGFLDVLLDPNDLARVMAAFTEMGTKVIEDESDLNMAAVGDEITAETEVLHSNDLDDPPRMYFPGEPQACGALRAGAPFLTSRTPRSGRREPR